MCYFINPDVLLHTLVSRMCYSKIQDVLLQYFSVKDVLFLDTGCAFPRYRMCYCNTLVSRMCFSKIQDVLFLDKGYAIPRYRMCFSKIQDVLLQDTGCAFPRYRMCFSKILDVLF